MKKLAIIKVFITFLILTLGIVVNAQDGFSLGPKIGYNSNKLTDNLDSIQSSIKNSFQIGAFIRIGSRIYIQPEANYQVVRSNLNKGAGSSFQSQDITVQSLKIPALIGIKLINKGAFNFRILAGPAYTFIINKKLDPQHMNVLWPIQSVDDIRNSLWSVQMGAGLDVLFMTLDVRYELGIDNIYNGNSNFELKNNMFNVSLGIKLL
jgi:hypothetical protein